MRSGFKCQPFDSFDSHLNSGGSLWTAVTPLQPTFMGLVKQKLNQISYYIGVKMQHSFVLTTSVKELNILTPSKDELSTYFVNCAQHTVFVTGLLRGSLSFCVTSHFCSWSVCDNNQVYNVNVKIPSSVWATTATIYASLVCLGSCGEVPH